MSDEILTLDALASLPNSGVAYVAICPGSVSDPPPPVFTFGAPADRLMAEYHGETRCESAGVYIATNIGLFERALLFRGPRVLRCDRIGVTTANVLKFMPLYHATSPRSRTRVAKGTCVLLLGRGYHVWGHWLIDFLPKLYLLRRAGYDITRLKYLVPANTPQFGLQILDMLGVTADRRVVYNQESEYLVADELLIPTLVRTGNRPSLVFKDAVTFAISLIREHRREVTTDSSQRRIFVSRGRLKTTSRRLLNREAIERIAASAGFTIIHPEQMSPAEQFALFANARQIAGDYGSALHTSIFSDRDTAVCALRGTASLPGMVQSAIGEAFGQPTGYVFGDMADNDATESFTVSEHAFEQGLQSILSNARMTTNV